MMTIKQFTFSPVQENTYILFNEEKECIIIDPGCYSSQERNQLKDYVVEHGLQPKYLLNTHCHLDHIFGNRFVASTFGLVLHIHPNEEKVLSMGPTFGDMWGLPFQNYEGELVFLKEGDTIQLGNDLLEILEAPGHSPGSICFYNSKQQFIIGGDVLFNGSIGRTDLPMGDFDTLINSIRTKLWPLPDEVVVYSGHGPTTTIGKEKRTNPFLT
jgi:glyoxylase-like metal-dependent hydrolase (beta-lactamase superfamily II)